MQIQKHVLFCVECDGIMVSCGERAMIWNRTITAYFKLLSSHSSSETEENHETIISISRNPTEFLTG
jgi:hypothetical protein